MKTQVKTKAIDTKVKTYFDKEVALLKSLGLSKRLVILFPKAKGKKPNFISRVCIALLRSQGGILDTEFSIKNK